MPSLGLLGLYSVDDYHALTVLSNVRVNTSVISEAADEGTIFLNVRKGLAAITPDARLGFLAKGNQANTGSNNVARFTAFMSSCGFSVSARTSDWVSQMKSMVYWDCAEALEQLMEYPWVRTSFKVSWAKTGRGAKLDHVSIPFQKYLEWLLMVYSM